MKPTDILSDEHRVIEQVLSCLEKMTEQASSDGRLDKQSARDAVTFFRNFADRCHHAKEEDHLFPAMEAKGLPREGGPTGVMRAEHQQARNHVRVMDESIEAASEGDASGLREFTHHARVYSVLLRDHIQKEDHCLYPMANQAFTDEDQGELLRTFGKVESEEIGGGVHETYVNIANGLADRYDVPRASTTHTEHGCGPCHG
ncbi:MAG: hemerythrin domain-containing protein [Planctomycetota bacterium]